MIQTIPDGEYTLSNGKKVRIELVSREETTTVKTCGHPFIEDMGEKWTFCEDVGCDGTA